MHSNLHYNRNNHIKQKAITMNSTDKLRRRFLSLMGFSGLVLGAKAAEAHHTDTHFEDQTNNHIVYQCNKADNEYFGHILFSAGEMLRKYGDDIEIVIAAFGPGIQLLGKNPTRKIDAQHQQRVQSLAEYGVSFHACGNTMKSLKWKKSDLLDIAQVVPIGVDDIMQLQQKGFSYIAI